MKEEEFKENPNSRLLVCKLIREVQVTNPNWHGSNPQWKAENPDVPEFLTHREVRWEVATQPVNLGSIKKPAKDIVEFKYEIGEMPKKTFTDACNDSPNNPGDIFKKFFGG